MSTLDDFPINLIYLNIGTELDVVYLSNRTNYNALAEVGCKSTLGNDESFLRTTLYSNSLNDIKDTEDGNPGKKENHNNENMIKNNHVVLSCNENGWTPFKDENVQSSNKTTSDYKPHVEDITPTLVCVTNTCGPPNVVICRYTRFLFLL